MIVADMTIERKKTEKLRLRIHCTIAINQLPWDSHENGGSFRLLMGMGMGIVLMGMRLAYFIGEN